MNKTSDPVAGADSAQHVDGDAAGLPAVPAAPAALAEQYPKTFGALLKMVPTLPYPQGDVFRLLYQQGQLPEEAARSLSLTDEEFAEAQACLTAILRGTATPA